MIRKIILILASTLLIGTLEVHPNTNKSNTFGERVELGYKADAFSPTKENKKENTKPKPKKNKKEEVESEVNTLKYQLKRGANAFICGLSANIVILLVIAAFFLITLVLSVISMRVILLLKHIKLID